MSFFDSIPVPPSKPPQRPRRPAWARPDAVIPGSVPAELILARTEEAAIAVGSIRAYPNGFEFTVHVRLRRGDETTALRADLFGWHRSGGMVPAGALRLGVMYADGRRAATTGGPALPADDPDRLILQQDGGGGNELSYHQDIWAHPLPPPGPVTLVVSWLQHGITEARAELDGTAIGEAAQRAVTLWPDEPEPQSSTSWTTSTITAGEPDQPDTV
jgi:hypothetical protein